MAKRQPASGSAEAIVAVQSLDSGNNVNWQFFDAFFSPRDVVAEKGAEPLRIDKSALREPDVKEPQDIGARRPEHPVLELLQIPGQVRRPDHRTH